ncbi:hypothetical protein [Oricola sp.]|uniref:hypothetical protein n=1 Tax=Oricola sp. TaxID=1979950 RepID=UPI003512DCB5
MAHRHGDGGASGAAYGAAAAGVVGGLLALPIMAVMLLGGLIYLRLWKVTAPLTIIYFSWYHPAETWDFFIHIPDMAWDICFRIIPDILGFIWKLGCELYATWPGFFIINLLGMVVVGGSMQGFQEARRYPY